jgi:hypothetical protein
MSSGESVEEYRRPMLVRRRQAPSDLKRAESTPASHRCQGIFKLRRVNYARSYSFRKFYYINNNPSD